MKRILSISLLLGLLVPGALYSQWIPTNGPYGANVLSIVINSTGQIFAGTEGGVFRSTDNGGSWTAVNNGVAIVPVYALAINSSGQIFASYGGVFRSTDNGGSWTPASAGLTSFDVRSIAISLSGQIFVATSGGVFRWPW